MFRVQDGASYHRAAPVNKLFQAHTDWLSVTQLPRYSLDYNPIEFLCGPPNASPLMTPLVAG